MVFSFGVEFAYKTFILLFFKMFYLLSFTYSQYVSFVNIFISHHVEVKALTNNNNNNTWLSLAFPPYHPLLLAGLQKWTPRTLRKGKVLWPVFHHVHVVESILCAVIGH